MAIARRVFRSTHQEPPFGRGASSLGLLCSQTPWLAAPARDEYTHRYYPLLIKAPSASLIFAQLALASTDILAAAAVLWVLIPTSQIDFLTFAAIYASALILGVLTHVPGGLGVFEVVILAALGGSAPVSTLTAALLAYRAGNLFSAAAATFHPPIGRIRDATFATVCPRTAAEALVTYRPFLPFRISLAETPAGPFYGLGRLNGPSAVQGRMS